MKSLWIAIFALAMSCAAFSKSAKENPMTVDLRVSDLSESDQTHLEAELKKIRGVLNLRRDPFGTVTTFTFEFDGSYDNLRRQIADIPYPGLRRQSEVAQLHFEGFDNRPPIVELLSPKDGSTITKLRTDAVVEIKDTDVKEVKVNGKKARKTKQNFYGVRVELVEGKNDVTVVALDEAGNTTTQTYSVTVDTKPPDIEATVKVVVEGKVEPGSTVFVDGQEAGVNLFGNWRIELTVKRGQRSVEVVAIDKAGNKKKEQKPIGL